MTVMSAVGASRRTSLRRAASPTMINKRPATPTPMAMPGTGLWFHDRLASVASQSGHGTSRPLSVSGSTHAATTSITTRTPAAARAMPSSGARIRNRARMVPAYSTRARSGAAAAPCRPVTVTASARIRWPASRDRSYATATRTASTTGRTAAG